MSERELFIAALEKSDSERAAWLVNACAGDDSLRVRVEVLLRAHERASRFLAAPAVEQIDPEAITAHRPTLTADGAPGLGHETPLDFLAPPEKPDQLGKLGEFEVLEVVGRGGMGVVLKAFEPKLHRMVALKVMAPHLAASSAARRRFEREAKVVAAVRNEHVVAIHAVETDGPHPYLAMEFIGGVSLQERLDQHGAMEVKEILRIGQQAALGLAAAHAQGLVHRDVKPANILLENGVERVKLTDFGLARATDDASITQSGTITGTPNFMSPEQADGKPVDHRSDLFSLGSVLYAMATGHPPFRADGVAAVLKRVAADAPRPVREINPDVPDWLDAIIQKLHAKNPDQRFQSAKEVAELLGQYLAHLQQPNAVPWPSLHLISTSDTGLRRQQPISHATEAKAGPRWPARLSALALIGLMVLMGVLAALEPQVSRSIGRLERIVPGAFFFLIGAGLLLMLVIMHVFSVRRDRTKYSAAEFAARRRRGRIALALVGLVIAAPFWALGTWIWWESRMGGSHAPETAQLAVNWNRDLIKRVTIEQLTEQGPRFVEDHEAPATAVGTRLPPGDYAITGFKDDRQVYWERVVLKPGGHWGISIFETPQGPDYAALTIECQDPTLVIQVRGPGHSFRPSSLGSKSSVTQGLKVGEKYEIGIGRGNQLLHEEEIVLRRGERRHLHIGEIIQWERRIELKPKGGKFPTDVTQMQIAPDRSAVAVSRLDGPIIVFDAVSGKERFTIDRPRTDCTAMGFTPDSRQLVYIGAAAHNSSEHVVRAVRMPNGDDSGRELRPKTLALMSAHALAFSRDGARLAVSSAYNQPESSQFRSRIHRFDWASGKALNTTVESQDGTIESMAFGSDGAHLFAASGVKDSGRWEWDAEINANAQRFHTEGFVHELVAACPKDEPFLAAIAGWNESLGVASIISWSPPILREPPSSSPPPSPMRFACITVSNDGRWIAAGNKSIANVSWEKRAAIRVWVAKTGAEKAVLLGHSDWILDLAFSADGKELVSTSKDGTVRTWKLPGSP
jgi:serine/threonine protein kinase